MRWILALLIGSVVAGGIGCTKRVSSNAVDAGLVIDGYLPADGGTLEWTSLGPEFTVSFFGDNPCGKNSKLTADALGKATCIVGKNSEGTYAYQIGTPQNTVADSGGDGATVLACRVGPCKNCLGTGGKRKKTGTGKASSGESGMTNRPRYAVYCDGTGTAQVKPSTISATKGSSFEWLATGLGTPEATINFQATPCDGDNPIGPGGTPSCTVAENSSGDYKYTATLSGCKKNPNAEFTVHVK